MPVADDGERILENRCANSATPGKSAIAAPPFDGVRDAKHLVQRLDGLGIRVERDESLLDGGEAFIGFLEEDRRQRCIEFVGHDHEVSVA